MDVRTGHMLIVAVKWVRIDATVVTGGIPNLISHPINSSPLFFMTYIQSYFLVSRFFWKEKLCKICKHWRYVMHLQYNALTSGTNRPFDGQSCATLNTEFVPNFRILEKGENERFLFIFLWRCWAIVMKLGNCLPDYPDLRFQKHQVWLTDH